MSGGGKPAGPTPNFGALRVVGKGGRLRDIKTAVYVCSAFDPETTPADTRPGLESFTGIWDTGATGTVITQAVVDRCGLKPFTMMMMQGAYGAATLRDAYLVNLALPNGVTIRNVTATWGEMGGVGAEVLIGMDVITLGDFAITNEGGGTVFSFRIPSLHTIDYVEMANQINKKREARARRSAGKNVIPALRGKGKRRK